MSIAESKKSENIVEYVLYMWNMERIQRASQFEINALTEYLSKTFSGDELKDEIKFHDNLSSQMKTERIEEKGHLSELSELMVELHYLHSTLLGILKDKQYMILFDQSTEYLQEFKDKTAGKINSDVEAMLTAIFGFLTLKMNNKEVSAATQEAISAFSQVLGVLASKYNLMKQGHLDINLN